MSVCKNHFNDFYIKLKIIVNKRLKASPASVYKGLNLIKGCWSFLVVFLVVCLIERLRFLI